MTETVRQLMDRLGDEVESGRLWVEIQSVDDGSHLVAGSIECHDDSVEFDDDGGFRNVLAFRAIKAVWSGHQGGDDYVIEPFIAEAAPAERWRIAS